MSKIPAVPSRSPVVSHGEPAHAFEAIVRARSAVERHRSLLERARRDLDSLVARSVSAAPESGARWWREPGVLTPEQTQPGSTE